MTDRNSTALRTSFALLALFSAAFFWGGNAVVSKILYRPDGAAFDAIGLFTARAIWSLPLFALLAWFVFTRGLGTRYSAFFVSGAYGSIGMALLVLVGLAFGRVGSSAPQPFASGPATQRWFFGEIVVGLSIYGQTAQAYALRTLGAGITSLLSSYGTLVVGLIGAVVLLGELLTPFGYVAAAMLAVALALALVPHRHKGARAEQRITAT